MQQWLFFGFGKTVLEKKMVFGHVSNVTKPCTKNALSTMVLTFENS